MDPLDLLQVAALEGPQVGDGPIGGADDTSGTHRPDTSLQLASEERAKRLQEMNTHIKTIGVFYQTYSWPKKKIILIQKVIKIDRINIFQKLVYLYHNFIIHDMHYYYTLYG